ncbi:RteC domain-containing protein [Plebeiibacterium marinum]|uniref:RteC domain-containing protein n=1 Tax=Plebeiibacterium marinum TaxID=2992111 RepID=A0AAE3MGC7_9BACT|nr:RteC domain-containing protein [Plebeiobacterium marinum]MCW3807328.1 RteC domain-containing protein [Plebeiobacterium marinum]
MEQKTERFIKKVENAFASEKVRITEFEMLIREWRQLISIRCYEDDDARQIHRNLNHLKFTVQWHSKRWCSEKSEDLKEFLETMIRYIDVELQSLRLKSSVEKRTTDIKGTSHNTMSWTATKRDLIELISALHSAKCINSGNVKLQRLVELFESIFEINLEYYHPEQNRMAVRTSIENRGLRAYFLSDLVNSFNAKIQNLK